MEARLSPSPGPLITVTLWEDAAGRPRDHSDSDKEFAHRVGVRFYTEKFFAKEGKSD